MNIFLPTWLTEQSHSNLNYLLRLCQELWMNCTMHICASILKQSLQLVPCAIHQDNALHLSQRVNLTIQSTQHISKNVRKDCQHSNWHSRQISIFLPYSILKLSTNSGKTRLKILLQCSSSIIMVLHCINAMQ